MEHWYADFLEYRRWLAQRYLAPPFGLDIDRWADHWAKLDTLAMRLASVTRFRGNRKRITAA